MAAPHKLLIVHTQDGVVAVQEVRVEDDLHAVRRVVEQLHTTDLVEDRVVGVVGHVVRRYRWQHVALECEDTTLEQHLVLI